MKHIMILVFVVAPPILHTVDKSMKSEKPMIVDFRIETQYSGYAISDVFYKGGENTLMVV